MQNLSRSYNITTRSGNYGKTSQSVFEFVGFSGNRSSGGFADVESRATLRANGFIVFGVDGQDSVGSCFDGTSTVVGERSVDAFDEQNASESGIVSFFVAIISGNSFVLVEIPELPIA